MIVVDMPVGLTLGVEPAPNAIKLKVTNGI